MKKTPGFAGMFLKENRLVETTIHSGKPTKMPLEDWLAQMKRQGAVIRMNMTSPNGGQDYHTAKDKHGNFISDYDETTGVATFK